MEEEILEGLERIGFAEREARLFLALLSRPGASAQDLAVDANLPRATCYDVLDELIRRGFATAGEGEFGRRYFPHPPEKILSIFEAEEKSSQSRLQEAVAIVPMLNVLYSPLGPRPRVRYREGLHGLRQLQKEYSLLGGEYIQLLGLDAFLALQDPVANEEYHQMLETQQRKIRSIVVTDHPELLVRIPGIEQVVLPNSFMPLEGEMTVCGDRVAFFSYKDDIVAVEIHSAQIAGVCKAVLELAWKEGKAMEKVFQPT